MYIEFRLASDEDKSTTRIQIALHIIYQDLHAWSNKYNIPYKTKLHKFTKRVMFDDPEFYSFFALTFEPTSYVSGRWSLIEPMNRPKSVD